MNRRNFLITGSTALAGVFLAAQSTAYLRRSPRAW